MSKESRLAKLYFDPEKPESFAGINNLLEGVKKRKWNDIKKKDVVKFLQKTRVYSLHKPYRKRKTGKIFSWGINYLWEIDLADFQSLRMQNHGVRFLLVVIDSFSKFLRVVPIKRKLAEHVSQALESIFTLGIVPVCIGSDLGGEFYGDKTQQVFKRYNIHHYAMTGPNKASNCERAIATLKGRIYRFLTHNKTKNYVDVLEKIVSAINATKHRSTKYRPDEIGYDNQQLVFQNLFGDWYKNIGKPAQLVFKKGDRVRLAKQLLMFRKGFKPTYGEKIYHVHNIVFDEVPRYTIIDPDSGELVGSYYAFDLAKSS